MSSVAPAAPSPSAPAAQPAPVDGAPLGGPEATIPAGPDIAPRLARPIKPIPSLPGVFPDGDPFPPPPSADATSPAGKTRGPDGRFLSGASPDGGAGEHAPESGQTDPAPAGKFKIAGEEHESQAAFEQQYKSLKGQYRPLQSLARSLGGVANVVPKFTEAAESARGWKSEAESLRAELDAYRNGAQPASATPTTPDAAAPTPGVDWALYAEIDRLARESGEPWKATQWLAEQNDVAVSARVQAMLDEKLAPFTDASARQEVVVQTEALFGSLSEYVNSDGSTAYPELGDPVAAEQIGRMWATLGLPPESALTPQGAIAAIAIYRMAKGNRSQASPTPPTPTLRPFAPQPPTDAHAAADLGGGRVTELRAPGGDSPSAEAQRVLAGLRSANSGNRSLLGFDA